MVHRPGRSGPGRRRFVHAVSTLAAFGLAGCAGDQQEETGTPTTSTDRVRTTSEDETAGSPTGVTRTTHDLDLREANVVGVEFVQEANVVGVEFVQEANVVGVDFESSGGAYEFSVTLYHDDEGEDGYADWWQVEDVDGERLGRRELLHAHGTTPFTRSETIEVPEEVSCVVVRGHDQVHEYGGQAMLVDVATGGKRAVRQGPDRRAFDREDCP